MIALEEEMRRWVPIDQELPPEGEVVGVISPSGNASTLKRSGPLWFVPDGSMYVYWTPIAWRRNGG